MSGDCERFWTERPKGSDIRRFRLGSDKPGNVDVSEATLHRRAASP